MIIPAGLRLQLVGEVETVDELRIFEPLELGAPKRELLQFRVEGTPSVIAASIEEQLSSIPTWPELSTHTFTDGSVVSIAYYTTGFEAQLAHLIIPILIGIGIGPFLLYFVSDEFREMVQMLIMMPVMILAMSVMMKVTKLTSKEKAPEIPKAEQKPFEQRVLDRIEGIASRVATIQGMFVSRPATAQAEVVGAAESLSSLARLVRRAPSAAMDAYSKEKANRDISELSRRLNEYESRLTPEQRQKVDQEQALVQDILKGV